MGQPVSPVSDSRQYWAAGPSPGGKTAQEVPGHNLLYYPDEDNFSIGLGIGASYQSSDLPKEHCTLDIEEMRQYFGIPGTLDGIPEKDKTFANDDFSSWHLAVALKPYVRLGRFMLSSEFLSLEGGGVYLSKDYFRHDALVESADINIKLSIRNLCCLGYDVISFGQKPAFRFGVEARCDLAKTSSVFGIDRYFIEYYEGEYYHSPALKAQSYRWTITLVSQIIGPKEAGHAAIGLKLGYSLPSRLEYEDGQKADWAGGFFLGLSVEPVKIIVP